MSHLKAVIFGLRDVIFHAGAADQKLHSELGKLLCFLQDRGITPVFLANRPWSIRKVDGSKVDAQEYITAKWGKFPWYVAMQDGTPYKPQAAAVEHVLKENGWAPKEVIYVGNTVEDMRSAVNGGVLFLNAKWHGEASEYGFEFHSPDALARFIDVFCLRDNLWYYAIEDPPLRVYSYGLYADYNEEAAKYTPDARDAAKFGKGTVSFWTQYLISTLYFSGICHEIDYACPYPGHRTNSPASPTEEAMITLTKCFRCKYLPDLIIRHTTATKSQSARNKGKPLDHSNQLNTICLNWNPTKDDKGNLYKKSPLGSKKTVLVIDDICTQGFSLEAARAFIEQTGANVISVSWLKTLNTSYLRLNEIEEFDPYEPTSFEKIGTKKSYNFKNQIANQGAPRMIANHLKLYKAWKWPET